MNEMEVVEALFRADMARDATAFLSLLAPGATTRIGGRPPLEGHAAIEAALAGLFASLRAGIVHRLIRLRPAPTNEASFAYQAEATFAVVDGRNRVLSYVNVVRRGGSGRLTAAVLGSPQTNRSCANTTGRRAEEGESR